MKTLTLMLCLTLLSVPLGGSVLPSWTPDPENPLFDGLPFPPPEFGTPSILKEGGVYKVWGGVPDGGPIRYSTSSDGITWTPGVATNLGSGGPGDFDQTYVLNPYVIFNPSAMQYEMWYVGQLAAGFSDQRIGFAVSPDGINWTKKPGSGTGGSVIDKRPGASELVTRPVVLLDDSGYRMWYFGADPGPSSARGIFLATSTDGLNWADGGKVIDRITGTSEDQGILPVAILQVGGELELWYELNSDLSLFNGTALATSTDGISWTRHGPVPSPPEGWCAGGEPLTCQPRFQHVIRDGSRLEAWYKRVGAGVDNVGYATGSDACTPGIISTIAGTGFSGFNGDGIPATLAQLREPDSVFVDQLGNVFLVDHDNFRVRRIDADTGLITTVAGTGVAGFNGDGILATSAQIHAGDVFVTENGDVFIADGGNRRVRKIDAATGLIETVALTDDNNGIFVDTAGNVFFTEHVTHRVRRIDGLSGAVTTVAGTGVAGFNGDGIPASSAQLNIPLGVLLDRDGNLIIADAFNARVRKVDAQTGIITTIGGTGVFGFNGDGIPAVLADLQVPQGIALDSAGNLYVADHLNHRIRRVDASTGLITTIAGTGNFGFNGDGIPATTTDLHNPHGVFVDSKNNVFIAGSNSHRVRKVSACPRQIEIDVEPGEFPNIIELEDQDDCDDDETVEVAILTTQDFNALEIDESTVVVGDPVLEGSVSPLGSEVEDVDDDQDLDLLLELSICDLLDAGALDAATIELVLIGATVDGVNVEGADSVVVVAEDEDENDDDSDSDSDSDADSDSDSDGH